MKKKTTFFLSLLLLFGIIAVQFIAVLQNNNGVFTYSLDDAYIHLSIAENIIHGNYGINAGEFCAAGSSIIWDFILAPFTLLPFAELIPFLLNLCFALLTLIVTYKFCLLLFSPYPDGKEKSFLLFILQAFFIVGLNLTGLVFTGMEHSLQVLISSYIIYGIAKSIITKEKATILLFAMIILAPLVRYENIALSLLALLFLLYKREYKGSIITLVLIILSLGGFSLFLIKLGLSPLPTSVSAKSSVLAASNPVISMISNFFDNLKEVRGTVLAILTLPLLPIIFASGDTKEKRIFAVVIVLSVLAHLIGGALLYWNRYYMYVMAVAFLGLLFFYHENLYRLLKKAGKIKTVFMLFVASIFLFPSNFIVLFATPQACNNIYEQQYQMQQFITEYYKKPVAVNDVGYPSWRNEQYVLDFGGLAYPEALLYHNNPDAAQWLDATAKAHNVELIMIYDKYFPYIPATWIRCAEIVMPGKNIVCGDAVVAFYAVNPTAANEIRELIKSTKGSIKNLYLK